MPMGPARPAGPARVSAGTEKRDTIPELGWPGDRIDQRCRFAHEPNVEALPAFPQAMKTPASCPNAPRLSRTLNRLCAPHAEHRPGVGCVVSLFFTFFLTDGTPNPPPGGTL
ncbi:hypothetical protein Sfum_0946 [Syntrophobacter fumaroxidans MPOB]|uniref:Uncharacterized protein n=1 Tax=Syntrophobacter fumaroxidans (strain DSM 10017 / MPOB) TaxID=335543 RepID=A0LGU0_SYNFM|nr:hypothetical protein Sfum_0946 [Syntrophobacter fumaroxidans MPOB]